MSGGQEKFIDAIEMIGDCIRRSSVPMIGKMPVLITVQFAEIRDEAHFHQWLMSSGDMVQRSPRHLSSLRDCQFGIGGMAVRLSSDQRVDDAVRRLFK